MWTYKGINVYPCDCCCSGIRWEALTDSGRLQASTKASMRELITRHLTEG